MNNQTVKPELKSPEPTTKAEITQLRRTNFTISGLTYSDITLNDINHLIDLVNKNGASHKRMKMTVCRVLKKDVKLSTKGGIIHAYIKVKGPYFDKREAISFNEDGFIGFAGWADKFNVLPFVEAFDEWLEGYMKLREGGKQDGKG